MSGICIRLYEERFLQRPEFTDAEIFRVSLATVILRMSALGLGEVEEFPFIEPPGSRAIADGLSAIAGTERHRRQNGRSHRWVIELGQTAARSQVARLLLAGRQYHCPNEILIIASALALQDPRDRPSERREAADAVRTGFNDERSDFSPISSCGRGSRTRSNTRRPINCGRTSAARNSCRRCACASGTSCTSSCMRRCPRWACRIHEQPATYEQIHKALPPACSATRLQGRGQRNRIT